VTELEVANNLVYEEHSVQILDYQARQLWNKTIPLFKVLQATYTSTKAIWKMKKII